MTEMSEIEAIYRQLQEARAQQLNIVRIRITTEALRGTITALPLTPERLRTRGKLIALPGETVEALPDVRQLDLLIHPEDWHNLLRWIPPTQQQGFLNADATAVFGIPVE